MSLKKNLTIILSLFNSLIAFSQTGITISGKIYDQQGTVPQVSVFLKEISKGVISNVSGEYFFNNIKPGDYTVIVSAIGYVTQQKKISIQHNQAQKIDFRLTESTTEMRTITVNGKTKTQEVRQSGFAVNAIETKQFANTTADLNQILNRTSGVRVREQGGLGSSFNFSINGLSGKAVKFFIDGVPTDVIGSNMGLNNVPVNLSERIEVYKGVVPVELGSDAMGGAVNVITNQNTKNYLDFSHSYGSFNTHRTALNGQYKDFETGLILKGSAFFNYSDNNYIMKGVEIWNPERSEYELQNLRRFNDKYSSKMGQLELGLANKKWADFLFIGATYGDFDQGMQTGIRQDQVYGGTYKEGHSFNTSIRYKKNNFLTEGLSFNFFGSRLTDKSLIADTLFRQYEWNGTYTETSRAETGNTKSLINISRPRIYARANLTYEINKMHSLNFNYTYDRAKNESYNELIISYDEAPSVLGKHIAGIAYQQNLLNERLSNTFFGKYYGIDTKQSRVMSFDQNGKVIYQKKDDYKKYYGYGFASRYKLFTDMGIKLSYEKAYRLQESEEMFGDGFNSASNLDLRPEQSNNINLGFYYGKIFNNNRFFIEAAYFLRDAKDYIYFVPGINRYENKANVQVDGIDGEMRYTYKDFISITLNASYQNAINTTKYAKPGSTAPETTYLDPIPNRPIFYGNADFSISKNNVFRKNNAIQFNWYTQYVQSFYLYWKSEGNIKSNSIIPTQYVHNAVISYAINNGRYNIALECKNLTDNLAYDNYRLQKPGRSFALKLRYFIK